MNTNELTDVTHLIHGTWPSVLAWHESLGQTVKSVQRTRRQAIFGPLEANDVRRAIAELSVMASPPWQQYGDRPEAAYAAIAEHSRKFAHSRRDASEAERSVSAARRTGGPMFARTIREDADDLAGGIPAPGTPLALGWAIADTLVYPAP